MDGSKVKIWKQDPTVKPIGIRSCYIHTQVHDGPKDAEIVIEGLPPVLSNSNGDFLFIPEENPKEFDAVHTFTVVRQVITMFRRALKRMEYDGKVAWYWGENFPIKVYPRAGLDTNAYYSRDGRSLNFYYFHPDGNETLPLVYTCRSFDIVAHETGHAILDGLKPQYLTSWHPQTGGLHESFGDLIAIFTMLAQMDQCEAIIAESKADLHVKTFFSAVAEQFGEALFGRTTGLRNADNDLKLSEVTDEVHEISQVFTGAIYDIIADIFEDHHKPDLYDPAESLFRVGSHMTSLVISGILKGPDQNATYRDIAKNMIDLETEIKWQEIIKNQFTRREIFGPSPGITADRPQPLNWEKCCGTLRHKKRTQLVDKEIEKAVREL